jgi:hypothetical protein
MYHFLPKELILLFINNQGMDLCVHTPSFHRSRHRLLIYQSLLYLPLMQIPLELQDSGAHPWDPVTRDMCLSLVLERPNNWWDL